MPPKVKFTNEEILEACISLIDKKGHEALTIRGVAEQLDCSTHPVMTAFSSIEAIRTAVYKKADMILSRYCLKERNDGYNPYLAMALNYIEFAKERKNLYRFLYLSDDFSKKDVNFFTDDDACYNFLKESMDLEEDEAKKFYECLWFFGHGVATLISVNAYELSDEQIEEYMKFTFKAMRAAIFNERK